MVDVVENTPDLWIKDFPFPKDDNHKYDRGYALIVGGGIECTGAAKLAATACLRIGAGLVSIICSKESLPVYASSLTSVMTKVIESRKEFIDLFEGPKHNSILIGPGNGLNVTTKQRTLDILRYDKACVIDADALTVFKSNPQELFDHLHSNAILTPHEGEFARLFPDIEGSREQRAEAAAKLANGIIVLKGHETLIAAPDGRIVKNTNAPATLATAGSGDVLAGIIVGLLAQKVDAFQAACMGVWIHSEAANKAGAGLISEELPNYIGPAIDTISTT